MRNPLSVMAMSGAALLWGSVMLTGLVSLGGCSDSSPSSPSALEGVGSGVYPMFADENGNGVNDFVEAYGHDPGSPAVGYAVQGLALGGHPFTDGNGDGICDYSQDGSNTWHGPGFVDNDGDGICDYWDEDSPLFNRHEGQQFRRSLRHTNRFVNAYTEVSFHNGSGHSFIDGDGDGICDRSQDGSNSWHGPGFVDSNGDGICDHYEDNGRGRRGR